MSGPLGNIFRRLRADNVPCTLTHRPGLGTVVIAGVTHGDPADRSAVLLQEVGGRYWIRHGGRTFAIPPGADDETVVDSVKLRVVHAWAEQGDPEAIAVLDKVREMVRRSDPAPAAPAFDDPFRDPFALVFEMFDTAFRIGWSLTVPSPWGVVRASFGIR